MLYCLSNNYTDDDLKTKQKKSNRDPYTIFLWNMMPFILLYCLFHYLGESFAQIIDQTIAFVSYVYEWLLQYYAHNN